MKKTSRIVSLCLSAMLLLSCVALPASAVDNASLSANAGTTVECLIVTDKPNQEPYVIEIPISPTATAEEEQAHINAAIMSAVTGNRTLQRGPFTELSYLAPVPTLVKGAELDLGGGYLSESYFSLFVVFSGLKGGNGARELSVRLSNETFDKDYTLVADLSPSNKTVVFSYNYTPGINLEKFSDVEVYATIDAGYMEADSCTINVSSQNYP